MNLNKTIMKLRSNTRDNNLVEDDFGSPIFQFLGTHPSDRDHIIGRVNSTQKISELESKIEELEKENEELQEEIESIREMESENEELKEKIDYIKNILDDEND